MRWVPDARGRLERAAFELFSEQGYEATTVPQITARAGLTTRTFFRHFADKREVIFGGDQVPQTAAHLIRTAPRGLQPMEVVELVLRSVAAERFDGHREETAAWRRLIEAEDSLRERDARKRADLVRAARAAFTDRGESALDAMMAAEAGALIFHVALDTWVAAPSREHLTDVVTDVLRLLRVERAANPAKRTEGSEPSRPTAAP